MILPYSSTNYKHNNLYNTCGYLLDELKIEYTNYNLVKLIDNHLDSLSLLAVKEALSEYGIETGAIRLGNHSYLDFELPFICSIQKEDWPIPAFTVVKNIDNDSILYLDPITKKTTTSTLQQFQAMDKGIVMLIDSSNRRNEINYKDNVKLEREKRILSNLPWFLFLIIIIYCSFQIINYYQSNFVLNKLGYLIAIFIGTSISSLLIWHEVDQDNKLIKQVCRKGKKMNCDAVLSSSQSSLFGVSWSIWGGSYFLMLLFVQLFFVNDFSFLLVTAGLSFLALPYVFYSIYVQWRIIRQWCLLCLGIQSILIINALIAWDVFRRFHVGYELYVFNGYPLIIAITIGLLTFLVLNKLVQLFKSAKEGKIYEKRLKLIKSDKEVFNYFLRKSERISVSTDSLGITLGNPSASNEIIKICNPYCPPCSDMHFKLEKIIDTNRDVKIRIIFTATGEEDDITNAPVAYFLLTQEHFGPEVVKTLLDEWYASDKDFTRFVSEKILKEDLKSQKAKIVEMGQWCEKMKIRGTPTLFINGFELPEQYRVSDLHSIF